MDKNELIKKLNLANIPSSFYSLNDIKIPEGVSLVKEETIWKVYKTDRGKILNRKFFDTEDEACKYILKIFTGFPYN